MFKRLRAGWLAGGGALVLTLALTGGAMAAPLDSETPTVFVDLDGNGVDDACQTDVVADTVAEAAAFAEADTDGDGSISVTEAAHSDWTGGANCNHGGVVSQVAQADADDDEDEDEEESEPVDEAPCEVVPARDPDPALDPTASNSHGAWVSWVAGSAAVGGTNCNHGGAVSEAAKKDHEPATAEREARKADQDAARAERDAARAERAAAREQRAQERAAAKDAKSGGKAKGKKH